MILSARQRRFVSALHATGLARAGTRQRPMQCKEPHLENNVSDLTNAIKRLSTPFLENQSRMQKCREQAQLITTRLLDDLKGLSGKLKETGLQYNDPQPNGGNLLKGSDIPRSDQGSLGVTVSMYTPPPCFIYECGIMIQVLNERKHLLYGVHRIRHGKDQVEIIWSEKHEVDSGSSKEQQILNQLINGLYDNLRAGLERFRQLMIDSTNR